MILTAVTALLAAMGVLLLLLCITAAALLPAAGTGWVVLLCDENGESLRQLRGWRFLQKAGLCRLPLLIVDCGMTEAQRRTVAESGREPELCCMTWQEWNEFREREERVSGT